MDEFSLSAIPRGSFSSTTDDLGELEGNLTLNDKLKVFKGSTFDPNAYVSSKCHTMSEKELRHLTNYLVELKKASAEEMRKSVLANYSSFIRTSKGISDLEGELLSMRNLLSTQAALVHGLAEGICIQSLTSGDEDPNIEDIVDEKSNLSKTEKMLIDFLDTLQVLLAEKRVDEAMTTLDEAEIMAEDAIHKNLLSPTAFISLQRAITAQRDKVADQLAEAACQPSTCGAGLRSAVLALKKLGDGHRAHTLLLQSHQQKLEHSMRSLRSTSYGGVYTVNLSQLVFSTIAKAANDSLTSFGEEPAYSSELVTWAVKQTEAIAYLLKKHILSPSVVAGSLRVASECVHVCLGHCYLLEARGLALSPILLRQFRPCLEQGLSANLKRIQQNSAAVASSDDWLLVYLPSSTRLPSISSATSLSNVTVSQPKLSSSAHKFNSMVQELFEDVVLLESLQLDGPTMEGVLQVFTSYVNLLINALPGSVETENLEGNGSKIVRMAETEAQQIALLANASLLAEELLPRAASKLLPLQQNNNDPNRTSDRQRLPEQRDWKRRLQRVVDRLRDSFCRQHALDLIFTEDGDTRLNALIYIGMDGNAEEPEWFPSPIFQELFAKLTRVASIASDMFVGRERFATILLMRLTETVILWLSDDQSFWEEIEQGQTPLGPLGLQQLYLDMEFVILFTSQGRYLSRNLNQVIKNIIARAIDAVAATGVDPFSVLPEEEWFAEVAQIAIKMLSGKANFGNVDRDVTSPTASVSARSVSSVHSHGSN